MKQKKLILKFKEEKIKAIEKKEVRCDSCGKLVPVNDIYFVRKVGSKRIENVCKNCISFVKKIK